VDLEARAVGAVVSEVGLATAVGLEIVEGSAVVTADRQGES
jgi:hypothetical protein